MTNKFLVGKVMKCHSCGREVSSLAILCPSCGRSAHKPDAVPWKAIASAGVLGGVAFALINWVIPAGPSDKHMDAFDKQMQQTQSMIDDAEAAQKKLFETMETQLKQK